MSNTFAIGVPVYNNIHECRQCLQSLLQQTSKEFDLYLFDDCSKVDYQSLMVEFKNLNLHYVRNTKNLGALQNMKQSFAKLAPTYNYIMIMHEDDLLHPQFIETVHEVLQRPDKPALLLSQFLNFDEAHPPQNRATCKIATDIISLSAAELCKFFLKGRLIAFGSAVYSTTVYKQMDLDMDHFAEYADRPFLLRYLDRQHTAVLFGQTLYLYRSHGPNDSRWKQLLPRHVYHLLQYYRNTISPVTKEQKRKFRKDATAFIFESTINLKLAGSFTGYGNYLRGAFKHNLLSIKYTLLQNKKINKAATAIKNTIK